MIKNQSKILAGLLVLMFLLIAGCGAETPVAKSDDGIIDKTETIEPTIANSQPSLTPTEPDPTASPTPEITPTIDLNEFANFSDQGISFMLHPALAEEVVTQPQSMKDGEVNYFRFIFAPEGDCHEVGCLEVYPVDQFIAAFDRFLFPPAGYGGGAAIIMHSREENIEFLSGSGTRTLEMHGQMGYFANNGSLKYVFRGYTTDQVYAVYLEYPIQAPILLSVEAAFKPEVNTNPLALPVPTASPDDDPSKLFAGYNLMDYNQQISQQLNLLTPEEFSPNLDYLDALVASLRIDE